MVNPNRNRVAIAWGLAAMLLFSSLGCQVSIDRAKSKTKAPKPEQPLITQQQVNSDQVSSMKQVGHTEQATGEPTAQGTHAADRQTPDQLPPMQHGPMPLGAVHEAPVAGPIPSELDRVIHPPYVIEPPDILFIDAVRLVPKAPYRLNPLDVLIIQSSESLPQEPIGGQFTIGPEGYISLGFSYGSVSLAGLTLRQAQQTLQKYIAERVNGAEVSVSLAQFRGVQQTRGEHLVRPDGTISLGSYGCVNVTGLTLAQAKFAIERQLSQYLQDPEISVDVFAYNSKAYYVILDGGGYGQQVLKFPSTGNETVLDAIEQIGGLPAVSSTKRIWVARPAPAHHQCVQILPVNWKAIVQAGHTATNYQLFPGDRVYVAADRLIAADNWLAKLFAPIERIFGITLLGVSTVRSFSSDNGGGNIGFIGGF